MQQLTYAILMQMSGTHIATYSYTDTYVINIVMMCTKLFGLSKIGRGTVRKKNRGWDRPVSCHPIMIGFPCNICVFHMLYKTDRIPTW